MSKLTSLFLIIIFFISLIVGIIIGGTVTEAQTTVTPSPGKSPDPSNTIGSVLFLGASSLEDEQIYLESAWIATINTSKDVGGNKIEIVLVAIYPSPPGEITPPNQNQYTTPHQPIMFPKDYLNNPKNFEPLHAIPVLNRTDIFFEDVVIVDEYGMNYIIALTNADPQLPPPPPTEATFCQPWDDPQHAHDLQHNILETLCAPPQNITEYTNFIRMFDLIPNHLVSTYSQEEILDLWQENIKPNSPPTISCKIFP